MHTRWPATAGRFWIEGLCFQSFFGIVCPGYLISNPQFGYRSDPVIHMKLLMDLIHGLQGRLATQEELGRRQEARITELSLELQEIRGRRVALHEEVRCWLYLC